MEQDNDLNEAIMKREMNKQRMDYEHVIQAKESVIEHQKKMLLNYQQNPFKAMLIELIDNDLDVATSIGLSVQNEVDNQVGELSDNILDEVDDKLDDQFSRTAFKIAVDDYMRSKF